MWSKLATGSWISRAEPSEISFVDSVSVVRDVFVCSFIFPKSGFPPTLGVGRLPAPGDPWPAAAAALRNARWAPAALGDGSCPSSDVCPAWVAGAGRGRGRPWAGVELWWRRRSFLGLDVNSLASVQDGFSSCREQQLVGAQEPKPVGSPGIALPASHAACTALVALLTLGIFRSRACH